MGREQGPYSPGSHHGGDLPPGIPNLPDPEGDRRRRVEQYLQNGSEVLAQLPDGPIDGGKLAGLLAQTQFFDVYAAEPGNRNSLMRPKVSIVTAQRYVELILGIYDTLRIHDKHVRIDSRGLFLQYYFTHLQSTSKTLGKLHHMTPGGVRLVFERVRQSINTALDRFVFAPDVASILTTDTFLPQEQPTTFPHWNRLRVPEDEVSPDDVRRGRPKGGTVIVERREAVPVFSLLMNPQLYPGTRIELASRQGTKQLVLHPSDYAPHTPSAPEALVRRGYTSLKDVAQEVGIPLKTTRGGSYPASLILQLQERGLVQVYTNASGQRYHYVHPARVPAVQDLLRQWRNIQSRPDPEA